MLKHRYRAQKLLGQGGFGKTFTAVDEHQPSQLLCVIKQFEFGSNNPQIRETALKLFYDEARHLESLGKHHNIPELLAYYGAGIAYGRGQRDERYSGHTPGWIKVGSYPANAYGLYDMHGNMSEWCADSWHPNYNNSPVDGSAWVSISSNERVVRGGKEYHSNPGRCRSAARDSININSYDSAGFRVVCC